mmetsp:Transcript_22111/g.33421  ORF Transcript_22111/g.33421 Transcript_22111/m.33421 type:complete len:108 (-) Transcript_22111:331-654(-)
MLLHPQSSSTKPRNCLDDIGDFAIVGDRKRRQHRKGRDQIEVGAIVGESNEIRCEDTNSKKEDRTQTRGCFEISFKCIQNGAKKLAQNVGIIHKDHVDLKRSLGLLV